MTGASLIHNVHAMVNRYQRHLEGGNHMLREGSQQEIGHGIVSYFHDTDPETGRIYTNGYIVAPGGLGKTISAGDFIVGINTMPKGDFVLGDPALGKRVLITVPTNDLVDQWGERLLGKINRQGTHDPSVFGDRFNEGNVGIYHADSTESERRAALSKPVIIMTHDSARALHGHVNRRTGEPEPLIRPEHFDAVLIDEVDDRPRGDVTGQFYKDVFFSNCMVMGLTATQLFRSGRTIGDYLFGGKTPICEITHREAVERREIAPHINIIVDREIDPTSDIRPRTNRWDDYTEAEQLRLIEQTGTDNALLKVIKNGHHPKTGKPLKDMMQLHQAVNVEHGIHIAQQLNQAFGEGYAEVVWGEIDRETNRRIKEALESGTERLKAVVQCKLWGRGTDIPPLEMTVQHAPSLSPGKVVQFHTRASRRYNGRKSAIYLSPFINGIDQLVVGELLGGLYMIPDGFEFPSTEGKQHQPPGEPEPWPQIGGVKVHYTQRQLEMFAQERQRQRHVNGLPVKSKNMLTLDEMAQTLGIDLAILRDRVYAPLQEAYEMREAREKFVNIAPETSQDVLHVRGKLFPVWRIGNYQHEGQETFCVDENLIPLCEHTLYGRLDKTPPEVLDKGSVKRLVGCTDRQIDNLWQELQQAFFHRRPYERSVDIDGVNFPYDSFGFYRNQNGASEFFLTPDALLPAYRRVHGADKEREERWARQPSIRQCKTSEWLTEANVIETLEINPMLDRTEANYVQGLFAQLKSKSRGMQTGEERTAEVGQGRNKQSITYAKRWLPMADSDDQSALCIPKGLLEWIKNELGYENTYDPTAGNGGRRRYGA